ncbi:hypothetical protein GCM10012320_08190 [Sinomonas cellulolyticus]|nr:hypothetical protein GCM10012320_08190 [Sinomonas sp. KCTC 49339]
MRPFIEHWLSARYIRPGMVVVTMLAGTLGILGAESASAVYGGGAYGTQAYQTVPASPSDSGKALPGPAPGPGDSPGSPAAPSSQAGTPTAGEGIKGSSSEPVQEKTAKREAAITAPKSGAFTQWNPVLFTIASTAILAGCLILVFALRRHRRTRRGL